MKKSILVAAIALLSSPALMAVKNVEVAVLDSTIGETIGGKDKSVFTYDYDEATQTLTRTETIFGYNNTEKVWINMSRTIEKFDKNMNQLLAQWDYWNSGKNAWLPSNKIEMTYNENGDQLTHDGYFYDSDKDQWLMSDYHDSKYNVNGQLIEIVSGGWDTEKNAKVPYDKDVYSYDDDGNMIQITNWYFPYGETAWKLSRREKYTYDDNGWKLVGLKEDYYPDDNKWLKTDSTAYKYDDNGNCTEEVSYWMNSGAWQESRKTIATYNDDDLLVYEERMYYDTDKKAFVSDERNTYEYNSAGKVTRHIAESYNAGETKWVPNMKVESAYNEYGEVSICQYYSYDDMAETYTLNSTVTYYYHTEVVPTALRNTDEKSANTTKVIRNGQLLIIRNGVTYNLQGARVD